MKQGRLLLVAIIAIVLPSLLIQSVSADSSLWVNTGTLTASGIHSAISSDEHNWCQNKTVILQGYTSPQTACVGEGKNIRLALSNLYAVYVSYGSDSRFYPVYGFHGAADLPILIPGTDTLIVRYSRDAGDNELVVYKNIASKLVANTGTTTSYTLERSTFDYQLKDTNDNIAGTRFVGYSPNGQWLVANVAYKGTVLINLTDFTTRMVSHHYTTSHWAAYLSVTNDGKYVSTLSIPYGYAKIYDTQNSCGLVGVQVVSESQACPYADYMALLSEGLAAQPNSWPVGTLFSADGTALKVYYWLGNDYLLKYAQIFAPGHTEDTSSKIDYLALGDSYSSGEGDTARNPADNNKYYRFGTDVNGDSGNDIPREKCHVSTRSYPYILSKGMALGDPKNNNATKWQSIACSGAQTIDITPEEKDSDRGQGARLKDIDNYSELKSQALNEFIPGRVKQIEFVKKYKPKVITLTMGGNDVGFEKVLTACASPSTSDPTCYYATSIGKAWQAKQILDEYSDLKDLYTSLYDASGKQAKIYVLGYPQFISANEPASCGWNIGSLNSDERITITAYLELMNNVIEKAASAAGVKYINIENSLDGGRLCDDGQKYVTGVTGLPISVKNERQESFHPNAKGHFEIAMTVWDEANQESLLEYDICQGVSENICPDAGATKESISIPEHLGTPATIGARYVDLTPGQAKKEDLLTVKTDSYTLRPQSSANITIHSDPINLGDFTVNADGSLNEDVAVPNTVPAGYHTLIVSGETYSGESIQYHQVILVTGTNPNDLDDNGVDDALQPCGAFIVAAGQDADLDGIDDACDPQISSEPELYRVRAGSSSRTYNNQPEHEDYLYVERNTRASSITGIANDYDPDSDGWAIVGVSQGSPYSTTSVPDTAPAANFEVVGEGVNAKPYVYIRAGGYGCVSFTPTSLAKVQQGQNRTIKKVAYNTDKCRQEPPEYDVDGNGLPDDTQPLYTARNGDSATGENPDRIYLYRNFYASEAQLGISDYTPSGTPAGDSTQPIQPWNLLASSKPNEYIPAFNKLAILEENRPTVLTKKQNGQCIAYQPENTEIIKMTTQSTRYLKKLTGLPGGVSCE